jgi:hypothetical protein
MKLKDVTFTCWLFPAWILATLRTITRDHTELRRITLALRCSGGLDNPEDFKLADGGTVYPEWLELDRLLAQLSESHSIRVKVVYNLHTDENGSKERGRMKILLPEVMKRGVVDLVEGRK